jgi:hypothetical protein
VDCGQIRQVVFGNDSTFDANSKVAVIYKSEEPIVFVTRSVDVRNSVAIKVLGDRAAVTESHDVQMTWRAANGAVRSRDIQKVKSGELTAFSDKSACTPSDWLASTISG